MFHTASVNVHGYTGFTCLAVTLCAWYFLIRMIPILLNYHYNAMDKVWYMGTYETIAVITTWILAKNKCHKQLMTASIMVIKSQPETSCCKFTKWRKRCFTLLLTLLIFQIAFTVLGIILGWLSDELSYFMLLPFKAGQLDIISGYPNLVYIVLTYQFIAAKYVIHTLMLITFTKISQFAYQSNLEWMKSSSFHLLGLTDLSPEKILEKQNTLVLSENSFGRIYSAGTGNQPFDKYN